MVTYGFFNSANGDRKYTAEQMSEIFSFILTPGVLETYGDKLFTVQKTTGFGVVLKPGWAWFDDTWTKNDSDLPFDLDQPDLSMTRIDTLVLVTNKTEMVRQNSFQIVKGTPAVSPRPETLIDTAMVHSHPLAYITVRPDASQISAADIEILVGKQACPFITSVLQTTDITTLFNSWEAQFQTWFEHLQTYLSEDVVTNLQLQITQLQTNKVNVSDKATDADVAALSNDKWMTPAITKKAIEVAVRSDFMSDFYFPESATVNPDIIGKNNLQAFRSTNTHLVSGIVGTATNTPTGDIDYYILSPKNGSFSTFTFSKTHTARLFIAFPKYNIESGTCWDGFFVIHDNTTKKLNIYRIDELTSVVSLYSTIDNIEMASLNIEGLYLLTNVNNTKCIIVANKTVNSAYVIELNPSTKTEISRYLCNGTTELSCPTYLVDNNGGVILLNRTSNGFGYRYVVASSGTDITVQATDVMSEYIAYSKSGVWYAITHDHSHTAYIYTYVIGNANFNVYKTLPATLINYRPSDNIFILSRYRDSTAMGASKIEYTTNFSTYTTLLSINKTIKKYNMSQYIITDCFEKLDRMIYAYYYTENNTPKVRLYSLYDFQDAESTTDTQYHASVTIGAYILLYKTTTSYITSLRLINAHWLKVFRAI